MRHGVAHDNSDNLLRQKWLEASETGPSIFRQTKNQWTIVIFIHFSVACPAFAIRGFDSSYKKMLDKSES
jgi:hypothetical protein